MICRLIPALLLALVAGLFLACFRTRWRDRRPTIRRPHRPAPMFRHAARFTRRLRSRRSATSPAGPHRGQGAAGADRGIAAPREKPEGDHVVWIPGYGAGTTRARKYIWISGFWRAEPGPAGRGPLQALAEGSMRVGRGARRLLGTSDSYRDGIPARAAAHAGPRAIDGGADGDVQLCAGLWVYQTNRVTCGVRATGWRIGRGGCGRRPSIAVRRPATSTFRDILDVPLLDRGLLFAPVRFTRAVASGLSIQPTFVIQPDFLLGALFVGTSTGAVLLWGNYFRAALQPGAMSPGSTTGQLGRCVDVNSATTAPLTTAIRRGSAICELSTWVVPTAHIDRPPVTLVEQTKVITQHHRQQDDERVR